MKKFTIEICSHFKNGRNFEKYLNFKMFRCKIYSNFRMFDLKTVQKYKFQKLSDLK